MKVSRCEPTVVACLREKGSRLQVTRADVCVCVLRACVCLYCACNVWRWRWTESADRGPQWIMPWYHHIMHKRPENDDGRRAQGRQHGALGREQYLQCTRHRLAETRRQPKLGDPAPCRGHATTMFESRPSSMIFWTRTWTWNLVEPPLAWPGGGRSAVRAGELIRLAVGC